MRRALRVLALLGIVMATALPASAHADLVGMTPAASSSVTLAPTRVTLEFSEDLAAIGSTVVVLDPRGNDVHTGMVVQGTRMTVPLMPITLPGTYRVNFRVLASDGHVVTQSASFTYATAGGAAAPAGEATSVPEVSPITSASPTAGYWITALLLALAALVAVGVWRVRRS